MKDFLWTEHNDPFCAALRLARYWKMRKQIFGEDRWMRPLDQTGNGALTPRDVELFRKGYFVVLVRPADAGLVLLVDESRLPCQAGHSKTRVVFYLIYLFGTQARNGITSIHIIGSAARPPVDLNTNGWAVYRSALPMRFDLWKIFVVHSCFEDGRQELVDYFAFRTEQAVLLKSKRKTNRIAGKSMRDTLTLLQSASGVERECLPRCIGGDFEYKLFDEWIRQRLTIEAPLSMPNTASSIFAPMSLISWDHRNKTGQIDESQGAHLEGDRGSSRSAFRAYSSLVAQSTALSNDRRVASPFRNSVITESPGDMLILPVTRPTNQSFVVHPHAWPVGETNTSPSHGNLSNDLHWIDYRIKKGEERSAEKK